MYALTLVKYFQLVFPKLKIVASLPTSVDSTDLIP